MTWNEERRVKRRGIGGWESKSVQARQPLSSSDLSESVCIQMLVCVCVLYARQSPLSQPNNRVGSVSDWGQLVAAEGRGEGRGGGERLGEYWEGMLGIRHCCLIFFRPPIQTDKTIRHVNHWWRPRRTEGGECRKMRRGGFFLLRLQTHTHAHCLTAGWEVKVG